MQNVPSYQASVAARLGSHIFKKSIKNNFYILLFVFDEERKITAITLAATE